MTGEGVERRGAGEAGGGCELSRDETGDGGVGVKRKAVGGWGGGAEVSAGPNALSTLPATPHTTQKRAFAFKYFFAACEPMLAPRNPPKTLLCVQHTRIDAAHTSPESKFINSPHKHPLYDCLHMCNGPSISEAFRPHCFTFHRHCFPRVLASQKIIDDSEDPTPHRDSRYHPNSSTDLHQATTPSHKKNIHQKKAPGPHERGTH